MIRSAACAALFLGLLLAPVPARSGDGPDRPDAEDCRGGSGDSLPPQWVCGTSEPNTRWAAKHHKDSSFVGISDAAQASPQARPGLQLSCSLWPHFKDCSRNEHCSRTPDRDGPHFVVVKFEFDQRGSSPSDPRTKRQKTYRQRGNPDAPLRVGL